ncbi:MAG: thioredoxin family protein [Alphaproteobacteria bacterium]|nr:thioredoxin family protein [Alphaproteobacteria bacterium]
MKKITLILLFSLFFILGPANAAEIIFSPEKTFEEHTLKEKLDNIALITKYFYDKYPEDKINEDMSEDVSRFFPELSEQEQEKMQNYIRKGLNFYYYAYDLYKKYQTKFLMPENPPVVFEDSEYANLEEPREYIENKDGGVLITDIKSVVPYTNSARDIKSVVAKFQKDIDENKRTFEGLVNIVGKLEWKKLPFYDVLYPSPLTGMQGIGNWYTADDIDTRILSEFTNAKGIEKIRGVIDIIIPIDKYVVANDGLYSKPQISFEGSENLKNWEVFLPFPIRLIMPDNIDRSVYAYKTAIPVTFYPENTDAPVHIKADITFDVCNQENQCESKHFSPELMVENNEVENSAVETFVYQSHMNKLQSDYGKLQIDSFGIKTISDDSQILEVSLTSKKKINKLSVYINSEDRIAFETPRISIDNKKAVIRFIPIQKDIKLDNKEFEIFLIINKNIYYSFEEGASTRLPTIPLAEKINLKLIFLAVLGGLILNFMPCVFPVLAIKIFSLTKFGATRPKNVRKNFGYTTLGIFLSFLILATFLAFLKYIGMNIGWGMQFQNPYFLITIIFAVLIFWLMVCGIIKIEFPSYLQQKVLKPIKSEQTIHFLTGTLAVLMSTPCTAPYLGTAIGFALSGSIVDIYSIIMSVALGLSLPYIIFCIFPKFIEIMPTPGPWMQTLNRIMALMLLLTIAWLFSVILAQTDAYFVIRLGIYTFLSTILLWLMSLNSELEYDRNEALNNYVKKRIKIFLLVIVGVLFITSLIDGKMAYIRHYEKVQSTIEAGTALEKIDQYVKNGKTVLVSVGADWCLTCHYNNFTTLNLPTFQAAMQSLGVESINIDWTNYDKEVLAFMKKHQRSGLPFYVLFSPLAPDGVVLPEVLEEYELERIIKNFSITQPTTK